MPISVHRMISIEEKSIGWRHRSVTECHFTGCFFLYTQANSAAINALHYPPKKLLLITGGFSAQMANEADTCPCHDAIMSSGNPWWQGSRGQHGAHLGPVGPRWAPCRPHEPCYLGCLTPKATIGGSDWLWKKRYFQILTNITIHIAKPMDYFDISGPLALQYVQLYTSRFGYKG